MEKTLLTFEQYLSDENNYKYVINIIKNNYYKLRSQHFISLEDFTQEILLYIHKQWSCYDSERASYNTFVMLVIKTSVYNLCKKLYSVKNSINNPQNLYYINQVVGGNEVESGEFIVGAKDIEYCLPPDEKAVCEKYKHVLNDIEYKMMYLRLCGCDNATIAETLGYTKRSVETIITRVRKKIKPLI